MSKIFKKITGGLFGGDTAAKNASQASLQGTIAGVNEQRRQFDLNRQDLTPFRKAGTGALNQQLALLGLPNDGGVTQQQAVNAFADTPGQRYLRDQQEKALVRNASATGGLGGGNIQTALQKQAFNIASTDFNNNFNRLAGVSGLGQNAAIQNAQLGANSANNISSLLQAGGQARASGILGAQQANAGLAGGLLTAGIGLFSDSRLKTMIRKIGELPSGLNWYSWNWKDKIDQPAEGVIAQEAIQIFPDAVHFDGPYLKVDYTRLS